MMNTLPAQNVWLLSLLLLLLLLLLYPLRISVTLRGSRLVLGWLPLPWGQWQVRLLEKRLRISRRPGPQKNWRSVARRLGWLRIERFALRIAVPAGFAGAGAALLAGTLQAALSAGLAALSCRLGGWPRDAELLVGWQEGGEPYISGALQIRLCVGAALLLALCIARPLLAQAISKKE